MLSISREHEEAQIKAESAPLPVDNWFTIEKETLRSFHKFPTANSLGKVAGESPSCQSGL